MKCKYFVILSCQNGKPTPLLSGLEDFDTDIMLFDTEGDAAKAASSNPLGKAFGYQIYDWAML